MAEHVDRTMVSLRRPLDDIAVKVLEGGVGHGRGSTGILPPISFIPLDSDLKGTPERFCPLVHARGLIYVRKC